MYVSKEPQCPSEEVDSVWHYHMTHTLDYLDFSALKMERKLLGYNPADGTETEGKYPNLYENTVKNIEYYFGFINPNLWPKKEKRFNQTFRWFSHHNLLHRCPTWKSGNIFTNPKFSDNEKDMTNTSKVSGYYVGCGIVLGAPFIEGGNYVDFSSCSEAVGCGAEFANSSSCCVNGSSTGFKCEDCVSVINCGDCIGSLICG